MATAKTMGALVPEQVAVVGVDNEEILCELCTPPLSSVEPNPERIGYVAAELLDTLMTGEKPASKYMDGIPIICPSRIETPSGSFRMDSQMTGVKLRSINHTVEAPTRAAINSCIIRRRPHDAEPNAATPPKVNGCHELDPLCSPTHLPQRR